jgi:hypothetical protein
MRRDEVEQRVGNSCGARITPDQLDIGDVKKLPGGEDSSGGCFTRTNKLTLKILVLEIVRKFDLSHSDVFCVYQHSPKFKFVISTLLSWQRRDVSIDVLYSPE